MNSEPSGERYVALRREGIAQGRWGDHYPRLIQRLTHRRSEDSVTLGDLWDNRLLVEALLVEGEYESAVERAAESRLAFYGEDRADARKAAVGFLLHSVTLWMIAETLAEHEPETAMRL